MPALTTAFKQDLSVDLDFIGRHARWLVDNGCTGIVALGSLGEGATLTQSEKAEILNACVKAIGRRVPVVADISALSTREAVMLAKTAEDAGCSGLMVLPPYVYVGDWREMKAHVASVLDATNLSCMLYNNPIAYTVDFVVEHENLRAIKESSSDVRRLTALRVLISDRLDVLVGVDDVIVEAAAMGAVGWIAGLVNAFPRESVELFELAKSGRTKEAFELYRWSLPLLRMDTVPKFVQLVKLVQEQAGIGSARVRPPSVDLIGSELDEARTIIAHALSTRPPDVISTAFDHAHEAAAVR